MKYRNPFVALLLISCSIVLFPAGTVAQHSGWDTVKALSPGTDLIVLRKKGGRVVGNVQSSTDDTIAVTGDSGSFVIGKDNVKKIFYAVPGDKKKSMGRGGLIGLGVGLLAGAAVSTLQKPESEAMPGVGVLLAGGLLGTWLGAKHGNGKQKGALIYSAN